MKYFIAFFLLYSGLLSAQKNTLNFDHNALFVNDLKASATFYMNILGLQEIENQTKLSYIRWFSMGNGTELHLSENKEHKVPDIKGVHFALKAINLDTFITHLKQHKVAFTNWFGEANITNTRPDGVRQIYLQDPNGYWIEINGE
jgi:catechol 2,3-dioxygenase-like lactoylglutathione lyase family enzyme